MRNNKIDLFCIFTFMIIAIPVYAVDITIKVKDDQGDGITSKIFISGNEKSIGSTDVLGNLILKNGCKKNQHIIAKPINILYEEGKQRWDGVTNLVEVKVTKKIILRRLGMNRDYLVDNQGDFAAAALISNELAARHVNREMSQAETEKTIKYFAEYLKFSEADQPIKFDTIQNKNVASENFIETVKGFQKSQGIKADGIINYKTLEKAAGRPVKVFMYQDISQ